MICSKSKHWSNVMSGFKLSYFNLHHQQQFQALSLLRGNPEGYVDREHNHFCEPQTVLAFISLPSTSPPPESLDLTHNLHMSVCHTSERSHLWGRPSSAAVYKASTCWQDVITALPCL